MKNPVELLEFSSFSKLKSILQTEAAECGLVCLAMSANYYGHKIVLNTLRREYPISLKGATLQSLIHTADNICFFDPEFDQKKSKPVPKWQRYIKT